jgi:hypothetical protein
MIIAPEVEYFKEFDKRLQSTYINFYLSYLMINSSSILPEV